MEADLLPGGTPLALGPIVVGESDAEAGVADVIHEAEAHAGGEAVAVVILEEDAVHGYAVSFAQENGWVGSVVEYVGKKNCVEGLVGKGNSGAVEDFNGDVSVAAGENVDAAESEIGASGLENGGDEAVAAANIEDAGRGRSELGEPIDEGFYAAVEDEFLVERSNGGHGICSVQRGGGKGRRR
jgi:hypothetical protein